MAELVGGALLSGFLNVLYERIASKEVIEFFRGKKAILRLLEELKIRLDSADELLNDAEDKQLRDRNVNEWLEALKDVIYDADYVVDKINTEALRLEIEDEEGGKSESKATKCMRCIKEKFSSFDRAVKVELETILANLKLHLEKPPLGLKKGKQGSSSVARSLAPLVEECDVYGRDDEKKALIELLLSDDDRRPKILVIPIVGMGGIGKTTLAQVVYYDTRVQAHFDFKAWVTVSDDFDVPKLTKAIFESITSKKCEYEDTHRLQNELKAALRGKKFLFVHDDVWNEKYELWDLLNSAFKSGAHGSKIIVTTRSEIVAAQMGNVESYYLREISKDDCWELFTEHAFDNVNSDAHPEFKKLGIEIVAKCKGLPLAVKSIVGLLRTVTSLEGWRNVLQSEIWELELREINNTEILPALWLSYSFLPPNLKRCFAFLSIFPKDYLFKKEDRVKIIYMWMAEGLLQSKNNERFEDLGEAYLNILIARSFFQRSRDGEDLVMHDLMHDLALAVSGGRSSKRRHFSFQSASEDLIKLKGHSRGVPSLRVLFGLRLGKGYFLNQAVLNEVLEREGVGLRVLSLNRYSITELSDSAIGGLKHLRFLDLSHTDIANLPSSICTLYNMQTLLLTECKMLTSLPIDMSRLINLRRLDIGGTSLTKMPAQMCNMKDLQLLSYYVVGKEDGSRIKDLGELQHLHGNFCITGLQNVKTVADASSANMKNKSHLDELLLEWNSGSEDQRDTETEVLNALEPHSGLKEVTIKGFGGTEFPTWKSLSKMTMVKVSLIDCKQCCALPPFGQLHSLKELRIEGMDGVVSIGDEFWGTAKAIFPSLEKLVLRNMKSWEKWGFSGRGDDEQECGVVIFPRLKELVLSNCSKMESVFPSTDSALLYPIDSLKELSVVGCERLMSNRHSWGLQLLSSLQKLYLEGDEGCEVFPEEELLLPTTLVDLWIYRFKSMQGLNGKALQSLTSLQTLRIWYCEQLQRFPEEGLPPSLTSLNILRCSESLKKRCQRGRGQYWPIIQRITNIHINHTRI